MTLISQAIAVGISIAYLNRKGHFVPFNPKKLILDKHITFLLFKIGLLSIVQQSLISISNMFVSTFVNSFGAVATNAFGAVVRVDMFAFMPAMSMSMAVTALTGQNLGAKRSQRVKDVFRWGVVMTSSIAILISLMVVTFSRIILIMFGLGDDAKVMNTRDHLSAHYRFLLHISPSCSFQTASLTALAITIITMVFFCCRYGSCGCPYHGFCQKRSLESQGCGLRWQPAFS